MQNLLYRVVKGSPLTNLEVDDDLRRLRTSVNALEAAFVPIPSVIPVSMGGTGSGASLLNNRIMISSGGLIVENQSITGGRALISDVDGMPTHSSVTYLELQTLAGISTAQTIQSQINNKYDTPAGNASQYVRGNGSLAPFPSGLAPSGSAGGDLAGTYPNPVIGSNKVTLAKFQQIASGTLLGRSSPGTGNIEVMTTLPFTIGVNNGGTGITSYAVGDIIYATATSTLARLPIGTAGQILTVNSGATALEYSGFPVLPYLPIIGDVTDASSAFLTNNVTAGVLLVSDTGNSFQLQAPLDISGVNDYFISKVFTGGNSAGRIWTDLDFNYTPLSNALNSANIFVGNGSNIATGVALSGAGTITNTGILTVNVGSGSTITGRLPYSNFVQGTALSVLGIAANATANYAPISSSADDQFMVRRSNALTWGTIQGTDLSAITAGGQLSGTYPNPSILNSAVIAKVITGYTSGAGTVAATDTILQAIQKLNGNTAAIVSSQWTTVTGGINYSGGFVGIGMPLPTRGLHIFSSAASTTMAVARIENTNANGVGSSQVFNNSGNFIQTASWGSTIGSIVLGQVASNNGIINYSGTGAFYVGAEGTSEMSFITNSVKRMTFLSTGFVGVGNTAPAELLSLGANAGFLGRMSFSGSTSGKVIFTAAAAAGTWTWTIPNAAPTVNGYVLTGLTTGVSSWGQVDLAVAVTGRLPYANIVQGSALSILGVSGNATANYAPIAAASDGQVMRRSGTSIGFGAVDLASANSLTGVLPIANGGTNSNNSGITNTGVMFYNGTSIVNSSEFLFDGTNSYLSKSVSGSAGVMSKIENSNTAGLSRVFVTTAGVGATITAYGSTYTSSGTLDIPSSILFNIGSGLQSNMWIGDSKPFTIYYGASGSELKGATFYNNKFGIGSFANPAADILGQFHLNSASGQAASIITALTGSVSKSELGIFTGASLTTRGGLYAGGAGGFQLGTLTSTELSFATNGSVVSTMTIGGDTGFGIAVPLAKVHVNGSIRTAAPSGPADNWLLGATVVGVYTTISNTIALQVKVGSTTYLIPTI